MDIKSQKKHFSNISRHYLEPEQIAAVKVPPPDAGKMALYHTALALVSERHAKYDLVDMVYALLLQWEAEVSHVTTSNRGRHWLEFFPQMLDHIDNYTVKQYGDYPHDQLTSFTDHDIQMNIERYVNRMGKGQRGLAEEMRDMLKLVHYASVRYARLQAQEQEAKE